MNGHQNLTIAEGVEKRSADAVFKALPDAHAAPLELIDAMAVMGVVERYARTIKAHLAALEQAITAPDGTGAGWRADITRPFIRSVKHYIRLRLIRIIEEVLK